MILKMERKDDTIKRRVVVFDFDGTLTSRDSLAEFIHFAVGRWRYYAGLLACSPVLAAYVLKLMPNYRAKERLFSHFFRGMSQEDFVQLGKDFAEVAHPLMRLEVLDSLQRHIADGAKVYVISASIEEWVRPIVSRYGVRNVLGTRVEVSDGLLTGRFLTKNCYGPEKVRRLLEVEPRREEYHLTAYGDSRGDREMLSQADRAIWVR